MAPPAEAPAADAGGKRADRPPKPGKEQYADDDQRDREFEERRRKIEIEQDLIYEQEEQHFREVN